MDLNKGKFIGVKLTVKANFKLNYERTNGLREKECHINILSSLIEA